MKFIDLFAGIGGFRYGIERAYSNKQNAEIKQIRKGRDRNSNGKEDNVYNRSSAPLCVYSNEWDKYANSVYQAHFGFCDNSDIRTVDASRLPDFDLLCGGFPCQSFSVAGKRGGFEDTRGTLFFEIARIARVKRPRYLFLENVKGLISHDEGNTFATIISTIDELGYDCQWQVLNSKYFGVPQNRERVFIVGHLRGTPPPQVFPIGENGQKNNELSRYIANTLTSRYEGAQGTGTYIGEGQLNAQVGTYRTHKDGKGFRKMRSNVAPTISARARQDGSGQPVIKTDTRIRRLTPVECERQQGFPDNWTKFGATSEIISDTQRYKMCGNAVTTKVITAIAQKLLTP